MSYLQLSGIHKAFQGVTALSDLDFAAEPGTITSIIGPNGAGKTTCLNVVSGFIAADRGTVTLDGRDITRMPSHQRARLGMARTFQKSRVFERFSVLENLMLGYRRRMTVAQKVGRVGVEFRDVAAESLALVNLSGYEEVRAELLSNAEQRRLELARVMMQAPRVLLMDEPTSGLDAQERQSLAEDIAALKKAGLCIVLVEHHVPFVKAVSDWIAVLDFGRMIAAGTPSDIEKDEDVVNAYLGRAHA